MPGRIVTIGAGLTAAGGLVAQATAPDPTQVSNGGILVAAGGLLTILGGLFKTWLDDQAKRRDADYLFRMNELKQTQEHERWKADHTDNVQENRAAIKAILVHIQADAEWRSRAARVLEIARQKLPDLPDVPPPPPPPPLPFGFFLDGDPKTGDFTKVGTMPPTKGGA